MRRHFLLIPLGFLALSLFLTGCDEAQTSEVKPAPEVGVAEAVFQPLRAWDEFSGRLEAVDTVEIRPRVGGYIDDIRFREGAPVKKGDVLFQIDPRPFQAEVDRTAALVEQSKARLKLARANLERGRQLVGRGFVSHSTFDTLQSNELVAKGDLAAAQAALETAQLNLEFTRVTSPIDGRASRALITRGNLVTNASLLTTVVSDTPIYASFHADEQAYLKYAAAERGKEIPVYMGLMTEEGYPHEGRLQFIDNKMDAGSGTINGRAVFDNRDGRFTPGLFARIKLVSEKAETVALVSDRAIATDLGKKFVLVVDRQNAAEYRAVTLGPLLGDRRIVRAGLKPGDVVIVSGLQKVKPGDEVSPIRLPVPERTASLEERAVMQR
ncbi:efflux RND transporter periplasmic adaptor subunit [Parvibaculum sp.]|uniref:efflux RND transporter periplasmic adaptor subunit n=1 Tax=Parvibaculum sp. TaxID=2024848 RepID=UPI002B54EAF2|nr:efflux RND transporter periplasmic adaptor subunit [Parvibaculum sp.]HUD52838.1 efflux RND transporter periplasmic adaptor subunit [Parvibaculum sp.]